MLLPSFIEKMKLLLLLCALSTLVLGEIANGVATNNGELSSSDDNYIRVVNATGFPLYQIPRKCPEKMQLHRTSTNDSKTPLWMCKCESQYLYFPLTDSCHEAYRQGPCPPGQYVNRAANETATRCVENPCSTDGLVPFDGSCQALGATCGPSFLPGILMVNDKFQLSCDYIYPVLELPSDPELPLCPANMVPYSTLTKDSKTPSWKCKCGSQFLYFPLIDSCHEAYRQGPCPPGQYVNQAVDETVTRCVENPCSTDGLVPFDGSCQALGSQCGPSFLSGILTVNEKFQLHCDRFPKARMHTSDRDLLDVRKYFMDVPSKWKPYPVKCPPGTMADFYGECRFLL